MHNNSDLSFSEKEALEEFLKTFVLSFRSASMYFREHPSFRKNIQELKTKLEKLSYFRKVLKIGVSTQALLIDGEYFKKDFIPFKELASLLHKRRIKSLSIDTSIEPHLLEEFVFSLASLEKDSLRDFSNLRGIEIEELDYSLLLSTTGRHPQDIWRVLLNRNSDLKAENIDYLLSNLESILTQIKEANLEKDLFENFFLNLEKALVSIEREQPQKMSEVIKNISRNFLNLSLEYTELFLEEGKFAQLKNTFSKYLDETSFFTQVVRQIISNKSINTLLPKIYKNIFKNNKTEEELSKEILRTLGRREFFEKREVFLKALKELALKDNSNKFISLLYKSTLSFLSEHFPKYIQPSRSFEEELEAKNIREDYFYVLLEFIFEEDNLDFLNILISKIETLIPLLLKEHNFRPFKELIQALEERIKSSQAKEIRDLLIKFYERVCNCKSIQPFLEDLDSFNLEDLKFILKRVKGIDSFFVNRFFEIEEPRIHKKLKLIITEMASVNREVLYVLREKSRIKKSPFLLKEVVDILCKVKGEEAKRILEDIYNENKNSQAIVLEILKVVRENLFSKVSFLKKFFLIKDYSLRREALLCFLTTANSKEKRELVDKLFSLRNFLGFNDNFILENIEIFREARIREIIPYLIKFILKKPLVFKEKRDRLRIKSLEALIDIEPQQIKNILPLVLEDRNRKIRNIASKFK